MAFRLGNLAARQIFGYHQRIRNNFGVYNLSQNCLTLLIPRSQITSQSSFSYATIQTDVLDDEPKKAKLPLIKIGLVAGAGLAIGALIAKKGAAFLSESNIFNPEVEDEDDED